MDWPISALYMYNLLKMPCNHNLRANRTKLASCIFYFTTEWYFSTRLLYTFRSIICLYSSIKVSLCSIQRCGSRCLTVTRDITPYFEWPTTWSCQFVNNYIIWYQNSCMEGSGMMQPILCTRRKRKTTNKQPNDRNFIMQMFKLSSLTVITKSHAVSSELWQELPQSINELFRHKHYLLYQKESIKNDNVNTAGIS